MDSLLQSESRRLYSWWWDSHIPKNSKWLQENLADMDSKVKVMIKLIETDADSFARRAEMYYKKRPELMKLVEELYRAYRALAERYDHTTVELRHAHKTMVETFPNQIPFEIIEDSASSSSSSEAQLKQIPPQVQPSYEFKDLLEDDVMSKTDVESLRRTLLELRTEKEALSLQYQLSLSKLSKLEKELNGARKEARGFDERAGKAEIEIKILKESLAKLEVERDAKLLEYNQSMERISDLEGLIVRGEECAKGLTNRVSKAEIEARSLEEELSRLQSEKETGLVQYNQCLELISELEKKVKESEECVEMFRNQSGKAENEIKDLKQEAVKLNEANQDLSFRYQKCLEMISNLEREVSKAHENTKKLSSEVLAGAAKVKTMEEQCTVLESLNATLMVEADGLTQKMSVKDQELVEKQTELEKLQALIQDQHLQFSKLEASLRNLESLHSQSQEEQKILDFELKRRIEMLKELEIRNQELEGSISAFEEENRNLSILKDSSAISLQIQRNEIFSLKEMKGKLEEEVKRQMNKSNALQEEIHRVKGDINTMNISYQEVMDQVRLAGLDPDSIVSSVMKLQAENSKLLEFFANQRDTKEDFTEKLCEMDRIRRRNTDLEKLLLESNTKLDGSREKSKDLQELCESLQEEKSELAAERSNLLSQLQIMTLNMQKLLEKNSSLETTISGANIELECLREKSKYFEDFFQLLKQDKSELIKERESLVFQLFKVEERLAVLEKRFKELERNYTDLQKMKNLEVEELQISLANEKEKRVDYEQSTETRFADLQKNVVFLQEECRARKKEFEEELDRVVDKEVEIFILQKFIEDLEKKNFSLLIECQKHVEASKFSEKLISELESENLEQQMESELFLDEIYSLRDAIFQVVKTLQLEADHKTADQKITKDQISVSRVLGEINNLKSSVSSSEYERQRLVVENSVLVSLLGEFKSDGLVLETKKNILEKDLESIIQQCGMMKKDKEELLEVNRLLKSEMIEREQREQVLKAELRSENLKFNTLQNSYMILQQDYSVAVKENNTLVMKFSELKDEMCVVKEENDAVLREGIALSNMSVVYQSFGDEMAAEVAGFAESLRSLRDINAGLKDKVVRLEEKLAGKDTESRDLNKKLKKVQEDLEEANWLNSLLEHQVFYVDEILETKAMEILEAKEMVEATHKVNKELLETVEELKKTCEESRFMKRNLERKIAELTELNGRQEEEIRKLNARNENLKTEIEFLNKEIGKQEVREQCLNLELQEKSNEFEIWDGEATSFYFDLQISAVREVLLENKVHELTGICKNLEDETVTKSRKIKEMKETVGFLECEVTELKTQLSAYDPVVASLAKDIKSLEVSTQALKRSPAPVYQQREFDEHLEEESFQEPGGHGRNTNRNNGIKILQEMKTSLKTIEQAIAEEKDRFANQRTQSSSDKIKDHKKVEEIQVEDKFSGEFRPVRSRTDLSTKDVPLGSNDQIVEVWEESAESETSIKFLINNTEPKKQLNSRLHHLSRNPSAELKVIDKLELSSSGIEDKKKILARLLSDSRRLASLRISLKALKTKLEINEKQSKSKKPDFVITRRQLKEMEEAILQLVNTNETLSKEIEETGDDSRDIYNKVVAEKSRNGSEKIEQLQNKMQNIEKTVVKLENGVKGRKTFSESKTVILLRDIIHKSGKRTARKKKNRFCGCIRSSSAQEE